MLDEEAVVISGLLVGLNVIDCNLGIKDEDLDQPVSILNTVFIQLKHYLIIILLSCLL